MTNTFEEISQMDFQGDIKEREGGMDKETEKPIILRYLSWASAHKIMKLIDPEAKVIEHEFPHYEVVSGTHQDFLVETLKPYRKVADGYMVKVSVEMNKITQSENYPVLNYRGQPVIKPSSNDINKALKRAFVKALAKHGVALYLYEGEDLPDLPKIDVKEIEIIEKLLSSVNERTGKDNKKTLIATVNKYSKQDSRYGKPIKDIAEMTYDQAGLFKIALSNITNELDKKEKSKK